MLLSEKFAPPTISGPPLSPPPELSASLLFPHAARVSPATASSAVREALRVLVDMSWPFRSRARALCEVGSGTTAQSYRSGQGIPPRAAARRRSNPRSGPGAPPTPHHLPSAG